MTPLRFHLTICFWASDGAGVEESGYDSAGSSGLSCARLVDEEDQPGVGCLSQYRSQDTAVGRDRLTYDREHQPLAKIGPWVEHVDRFLLTNEGKAARERLTLIGIYEEVRALGYDGSYDAVRRYAKTWSKTWSKARGSVTAQAYVPL